jgi:hypothetical protein
VTAQQREAMERDLRTCAYAPGAANLIWYGMKGDGFTYGGYEFGLPYFSRCMVSKGYTMSTPSVDNFTNLATRPDAALDATWAQTDEIIKRMAASGMKASTESHEFGAP